MRRLTTAVWAALLLIGTYGSARAADLPLEAARASRPHEAAVLNATAARSRHVPAVPWHQQALPLPALTVVLAVAAACLVRAPELRRAWPHAISADGEDGAAERVQPVAAPAARLGRVIVTVLAFGFGAYLAWAGMQLMEADQASQGVCRFVLGCVIAGGALYAFNALADCRRTLSSFVAERWEPVRPRADTGRLALLVILAVVSLAGCMLLSVYHPEEQAVAVALWFAAQIWIIAAAFPPVRADAAERAAARRVRPLVVLLLLGAILTHLWQIGYYPDFVHHDHSVFGHIALQTLSGDWRPFFVRIYSVGRPWFLPTMAALAVFGHHYWVLRLIAGLAGVAIVWGTYLLGASLLNRRIGLIAALLVLVNNDLLLYSRQPYVVDPVAPFVLALYAVVVGLRRGCRLHWCLAGILGGWSLLMYRSSTIFPVIGAVLLLYIVTMYPREVRAQWAGILWLLTAACIVYVPTLPDTLRNLEDIHRLQDSGTLFDASGALRGDAQVWAHQLLHSFGALIYFRDSGAWWVTTGQSICMPLGSCLLGIGLVYLLTSWWTPATFVLIAWTAICVFMGSAMIVSPPTLYHILAAIVAVMLISAVTVDRVLAVAERQPRWQRLTAYLLIAVLLGAACAEQLRGFWSAVRRPARADGRVVLQENQRITAARYIREHPQYRYYLVRSPAEPDTTCTDVLYEFFADDSDVSDITATLASSLPVPPVEPAAGAAFIVFPRRAAERQVLATIYPDARVDELFYAEGSGSLLIYTVDAKAVREVFTRPTHPPAG